MNRTVLKFIEHNIENHPQDIVSLVADNFQVSRKTAHKHVRKLVDAGILVKTGHTKGTQYTLASKKKHVFSKTITNANEDDMWRNELKDRLQDFPTSLKSICQFVFTEMANNAIEHSEGKKFICDMRIENEMLVFTLQDDGIGIFNNIQRTFHFENIREAILHLHKGKLTTDPKAHTGQGIFFSARACDSFSIQSGKFTYSYHAKEDDWYVQETEVSIRGTLIAMHIATDTTRVLKDVFDAFTEPDSFAFDRSQVTVRLSLYEKEPYISRAQAKRLLEGLDVFTRVTLDFKKVETVGQGFVDQVFRVWQQEHPSIHIDVLNTSDDVQFMIDRGLTSQPSR